MGYERYPRGSNPQGDYYGRTDPQDYGRDYGSGRDYGYSSARDYQAAGRDRDDERRYGAREYGNQRYGQRDQFQGGRGNFGYDREEGRERAQFANRSFERNRYGADADRDRGGDREYHGSYGSGGRRFEDFGPYAHADDDNRAGTRGRQAYGRQPQGYDYEDRGFFARAGDEVRSWFGDEEAERRREYDSRLDDRHANDRDSDYHSWRRGQIQSLDRDYDEYRRENRSKFESEFGSWRSTRQTQRDALNTVEEHMDVVGSDGEHVGTVDKVRGDRILLTKNDSDAGGRHHSIPSSWLQTVDTKVTLSKSAADAKAAWRDEERSQALFGDDDGARRATQAESAQAGTNAGKSLNRSFSGTY